VSSLSLVFVIATEADTVELGIAARSSCEVLTSTPPSACAAVPGSDRASRTAAVMSRRPAPCCSPGAPMSLAELVRICFTSAGAGSAPRWVAA